MKEILTQHLSTFLGLMATGLAGFVFGKKKMNAEVAGMDADNEGKEIENADKLVKLYKDALDDLAGRYEVKFKEFSNLAERKIKLLEEEINIQKRINDQLKTENSKLRAKLKEN
ncbi:MAG: LPXTG cell wall anchor domain-containing protein [Chryseobacterium sp.]|jgi:LPXTG-motif cell wall-anchored protein|uniref:LPXTG cell wall anchor domain-containing protein n=1 Tax=Chryseobacterium sp. TaxID=1871047 RepID=UPI00282D6FB1|nr:LPXTG cell wall anchor domain-containing protein [Chryseobacterium sp.]MDR2238153.1 LPXTG cell wall anchor domain-containing protein [Chryseobacterium sp.]